MYKLIHKCELDVINMNHKKWLNKALEMADHSNCQRAHFGSYIIKDKKILGVGCNTSIRPEHCCLKPKGYRIGNNPGLCWAVHAEWSALIDALQRRNNVNGATLYIAGKYPDGRVRKHSFFSCTVCIRLLLAANIKNIVRIGPDGEPLELSIDEAVDSAYHELIDKGGGEVIA